MTNPQRSSELVGTLLATAGAVLALTAATTEAPVVMALAAVSAGIAATLKVRDAKSHTPARQPQPVHPRRS